MHSRLTPLAGALRLVLFGLSLGGASHSALAADSSAQHQPQAYDIPAGSLDQVLGAFGQQSGAMIAADSALTQGLHSAGLKGRMDVPQGLERLLAPLGLAAVADGAGYRVQPRPAASGTALELGVTNVGANQLGTITEGTGSYTPGTIATATRLVLTPRETPQSISVVTRQVMDDFGLNSIDDVMRHTPGVTVSTYDSDRTSFNSRGFAIKNFQYDGIPTLQDASYSAGQTQTDMAIYDRIEVLKGAPGLLAGAGGPGGVINLIRKKPTDELKASVQLGAGSWDSYSAQLDVGGPLTDSGNVRGRAVAVQRDKHSFMDHYERKTSVYYGILEVDLDPDTLLTLGADYQDNDPKGSSWSGSASLYDSKGEPISTPRSYNNGANFSGWAQYTRTAFATLEHSFENGWVAKGQYNHQINGYHAPMGNLMSPNASTGQASLLSRKFTGETVSDSGDLYVSGPFSLLGREHQLVVGSSVSKADWTGKNYTDAIQVDNSYDYYNWDGDGRVPDWGKVSQVNDETTRQSAGYVAARFSLADDLSLLLGTRVANFQVTGNTDLQQSGKVVPYAGLVYDLNDNFSAYTSYTEIFLPQNSRDRNNKMLRPNEGKNYEVGIKGEFFGGRLNSSLAYFEVHEKNRAVPDEAYNANPDYSVIDYAEMGITSKTKGYEAEISGELAPGWQLQGGYTHKVSRDESGAKVGTSEPEDQLSLYTSYKLGGSLDKLTLGGGTRWQGESWRVLTNYSKNGAKEKFSQDPYWLVDLMARYQLTDNLSATLNLNNAFDKKYLTNIGFFNAAYYGDPRNLMLTTRWDF